MSKCIYRKIIKYGLDIYDRILIKHRRRHEIKRFKDPRRKQIFSKVDLTKEQKKAIDNLYSNNYGEKIPYIWHQYYTAFTGNFDVNYYPELLFIPELEHIMNRYTDYVNVFADKNVLPLIAKAAGVKTPYTYLSCVKGILRDEENHIISLDEAVEWLENKGEAFIKPTVDTASGQGCAVVNFSKGIDLISGRSIADVVKKMGKDFIIQERIVCHQSVSKIYDNCVNTFRIITYFWKDKIEHAPAIMRIGRSGGYVDNAHAGGMFIAIDDSGKLHEKAFTEFGEHYLEHPDTHICYAGYLIDRFPEVLQAAKHMHEMIPQIGIINWDFTLDKNGDPILIEANTSSGSIWLVQIAHGAGVFGTHTEEILRWLKEMKKMPKSKR